MAAVIKNFDEVIDGKRYSYHRSTKDEYTWALFIFPIGQDSLMDIEDAFHHTFTSKYVTKAQVKEVFSSAYNQTN